MSLLSTDPTDFLLDSSGDVVIGTDAELATGSAGVAQAVRNACLAIRGEWFLDLDDGMPLLPSEAGLVDDDRAILGGQFIQARAEADYRLAILAVDGVGSLDSLSCTFDPSTRGMGVEWTVTTIFGDTITDALALP